MKFDGSLIKTYDLDIMPDKSGIRGLTDRFCNHIDRIEHCNKFAGTYQSFERLML